MVTTNESTTVIDSVLRDLKIGIDSDVVIASSFLSSKEEADFSHRFKNMYTNLIIINIIQIFIF